ncbi:MAG: hypothetical protein JNL56_09360 [Alphaproteobacteria bacterium]|nr:hypothetical protein [Alphaproteobacteria bacterium]
MPLHRRPRARTDGGAGWDVWLPAVVAIAAALFIVGLAQAAEAPRPIFDAARFEPSAVARESAAAAPREGLAVRPVAVAALPDLSPRAAPPPDRPVTVARNEERQLLPAERLAAAAGIAALLVHVLLVLARQWRRTERLAA